MALNDAGRRYIVPALAAASVVGLIAAVTTVASGRGPVSAVGAPPSSPPQLGRADMTATVGEDLSRFDKPLREHSDKVDVLARTRVGTAERVLVGVKSNGKRCLSTYVIGEEAYASTGCGAAVAVDSLQFKRAHEPSSSVSQYVAGQAPQATEYLLVARTGEADVRVDVSDGGSGWKAKSFIFAAPAEDKLTIRAYDGEGSQVATVVAP